MKYNNLHLHTTYSMLDGANKIEDVFLRAKKDGQSGVAITDHGNMHGALEFYEAGKKLGIKPIIGCELYVVGPSNNSHHLTVIAKDKIGYKNLCTLSYISHKEHFYKKPRVTIDDIERHKEGLIIMSGCLGSALGTLSKEGREDEGVLLAQTYSRIFKDNYYLEIQPHKIPEQVALNELCYHIHEKHGINIVATSDSHYIDKCDCIAQQALFCMSINRKLSEWENREIDLSMRSAEEMFNELNNKYAELAINNTEKIVNDCADNVFDFSIHIPKIEGSISSFRALVDEGLRGRLQKVPKEQHEAYRERNEREVKIIEQMGFCDYFLVVSDFIRWAKDNNIPVGTGRGSAAGSLVAFCLKITEVDPILHNLLFERFLNPDRVSLPDIDVDFCINGRDRVIDYVTNKYGECNVAQIATFGTLKARSAIRDVGRVLDVPYDKVDTIAKLVPEPRQGFDYSLTEALSMEPRLKEYADGEGKELITLALKLEGLTRHSSTHAAGVVIGDKPIYEIVPVSMDRTTNRMVTQYPMKYVEKSGLIKFDFLGLKTLTVIDMVKKMAKLNDINSIPLDDIDTYKTLSTGRTTGIFQLEGNGITEALISIEPNSFEDIVSILALYRPAILEANMLDSFIKRRKGEEPIVYEHFLLEPILKNTYGIMVYQEQIMEIVKVLAGFSLPQADILRRAMGKKDLKEMEEQKNKFISGCINNSIDKSIAENIFNKIETFARYGFNRSHAVAYALISYQTAYLKTHYPVEFMAALMTCDISNKDKISRYRDELIDLNIQLLRPCVNKSLTMTSIEGRSIRLGLATIAAMGEKTCDIIVNTRGDGFKDINDCYILLSKVIGQSSMLSLVDSGALDCFGVNREFLYRNSNKMYDKLKKVDSSLFDITIYRNRLLYPIDSAFYNKRLSQDCINREYEALGIFVDGHPIKTYKSIYRELITLSDIDESKTMSCACVVSTYKVKSYKDGRKYLSGILSDGITSKPFIMWNDIYSKYLHYIDSWSSKCLWVTIKGQSVTKVLLLDDYIANTAKSIDLYVTTYSHSATSFKNFLDKISDYAGPTKLNVVLVGEYGEATIRLRGNGPISIKYNSDIYTLCKENNINMTIK